MPIKLLKDRMHAGAVTQLRSYVKSFVVKSQLWNGREPSGVGISVDDQIAGKILALLKVDYLERNDIVDLMYGKLRYGLNGNIRATKEYEPLEDILGTNRSSQIEQHIFDFLLNLPHDYEVLVPLICLVPQIIGEKPVEITNRITIFPMTEQLLNKGYLAHTRRRRQFVGARDPSSLKQPFSSPQKNIYYLSLVCSGYAGDAGKWGGTLRGMLKTARILVGALIACDLVSPSTPNRPTEGAITIWNADYWEKVPINQRGLCYIYPRTTAGRAFSLRLPDDDWALFSTLCIKAKAIEPGPLEKQAIEVGKRQKASEGVSERLRRRMCVVGGIFPDDYDPKSKQFFEIERVRTALMWFYEGYRNSNAGFSFVQMAIGLEALLGEPKRKTNISERIADRCAYLIGVSPSERKAIKADIETAYDVRSRIVHRGDTILSNEDAASYQSLVRCLKDALAKEISALDG